MERKALPDTGWQPSVIESVDRALRVLTILMEQSSAGVSEIARDLGVSVSTAHRLLTTLSQREFAEQDERRRYRLGSRMSTPAPVVGGPSLADLVRAIRPFLSEVHDRTGETVHLMMLRGNRIAFVDGIESDQVGRITLRLGAQMPAHTTSGGKAILARMNQDDLESLYPDGIPQWTECAASSLEALRHDLARVRRRGFGINTEESETGVAAVGAALGRLGGGAFAISVAVPSIRAAREVMEQAGLLVRSTAARARREVLSDLLEKAG